MNSSSPVSNPWFGVSMALVGVIVGYAMASVGGFAPVMPSNPTPTQVIPGNDTVPTPTPPAAAPTAQNVKPVDKNTDHIRGDVNAPISLIMYDDLECPFCARHHPTALQLLSDYAGKLNLVYRHFPLSFHPNAQKGAEASECVAELAGNDKFWEFVDMVFEKGAANSQYVTYAKELGVDEAKFNDCLNSGKYAAKVAKDMDEGSAAGVNGTPGNIVVKNGTDDARSVSGAQPIGNFKTIIDSML